MDKNTEGQIERLLNQIMAATDNIKSVGAQNTMDNAGQLMGIRQATRNIWRLVTEPEKDDKQEVNPNG